MSGIKVSKKALAQFEEMKKKRTHKFLIMGIEKEKVEVVDGKSGDKKVSPSYADFTKALCVPKKAQWGIIDYEVRLKIISDIRAFNDTTKHVPITICYSN